MTKKGRNDKQRTKTALGFLWHVYKAQTRAGTEAAAGWRRSPPAFSLSLPSQGWRAECVWCRGHLQRSTSGPACSRTAGPAASARWLYPGDPARAETQVTHGTAASARTRPDPDPAPPTHKDFTNSSHAELRTAGWRAGTNPACLGPLSDSFFSLLLLFSISTVSGTLSRSISPVVRFPSADRR